MQRWLPLLVLLVAAPACDLDLLSDSGPAGRGSAGAPPGEFGVNPAQLPTTATLVRTDMSGTWSIHNVRLVESNFSHGPPQEGGVFELRRSQASSSMVTDSTMQGDSERDHARVRLVDPAVLRRIAGPR